MLHVQVFIQFLPSKCVLWLERKQFLLVGVYNGSRTIPQSSGIRAEKWALDKSVKQGEEREEEEERGENKSCNIVCFDFGTCSQERRKRKKRRRRKNSRGSTFLDSYKI